MSSLSIVVPAIGSDLEFENTLASVLRFRLPHHQVIVVLGPDQNDAWDLGEEAQFVNCDDDPGYASCLNAALPVVRGDVVNVLRPGVEVRHHWFAHGMRLLQDPTNGMVAVPLTVGGHPDDVVSLGLTAGYRLYPRHSLTGRPLAPSSWAGFFRTGLLMRAIPLETGPGAEFVTLDVALGIRSLGYFCAVIDPEHPLAVSDSRRLHIPVTADSGRDAGRLVRRHYPDRSGSWRDRIAAGWELATSLVHPRRMIRLAGRSRAAHQASRDQAFHAMWYGANPLNGKTVTGETDRSSRRAA